MVQELFDGEARRAVRDLGRTFFVEASAGTGKTRLLCDRALQALLTPGYNVYGEGRGGAFGEAPRRARGLARG
jgi:hypothetical protein